MTIRPLHTKTIDYDFLHMKELKSEHRLTLLYEYIKDTQKHQ
ncbi:hypothetical protein [Paenibacillus germinis]|nr:hypothetical protein [Paenibacillus germinis]